MLCPSEDPISIKFEIRKNDTLLFKEAYIGGKTLMDSEEVISI